MLKLLRRGFARLFLHLANIFVVPVELVSPRLYMRFYTWLLMRYGMHMTGVPRYISSRARFDDFDLITLGERTVISKYVILLTHDYSITTALIANGHIPPTDVASHRPIRIGNNVFVGMNVILMPGTTVEDNVIIGAGSVVRGHIEENSIVAGNPAVKIGSLTDHPDVWLERSRNAFASRDHT